MTKLYSIVKNLSEFIASRDGVVLTVSAISLVVSLFQGEDASFNFAWVATILCAYYIVHEVVETLVKSHTFSAELLVLVAIIASLYIGEYLAAGEVAFIMRLGETLEKRTTRKTRSVIENLAKLAPRRARILRNGGEEILVDASEVKVGDIIRVLPGETIPVDGKIIRGNGAVDEQALTGESFPVDKGVGDPVLSGGISRCGSFDMTAEKVDSNSSIQRIVRLLQEVEPTRTRVGRLVDRWAAWLVCLAVSIAILAFACGLGLKRAATVLIVFCPCAFVLATPTAIAAALGSAARRGVLFRSGDTLEHLARVEIVAFDKTGTITQGKLSVAAFKSLDSAFDDSEILALAGSVESFSEHPVGRAINQRAKEMSLRFPTVDKFSYLPGNGVEGVVNGALYQIGSERYMNTLRVDLTPARNDSDFQRVDIGKGVVYVATEGKLVGFIALIDVERAEARKTINAVKALGLDTVVLSGDSKKIVRVFSEKLGFDAFRGELLPEEKVREIQAYQRAGKSVCMVGDGVNDALALKCADVGAGLGGVGSDVALDASDIVLSQARIVDVPYVIQLARKTYRTIKVNLTFSCVVNAVAISLALTGTLSPVYGAIVHNASSLLVVLNSLRLIEGRRVEETTS